MKNSWLITVPKHLIQDFLLEIDMVKETTDCKRFRVPHHIKNIKKDDLLYVVYDSKIRGYMPVIGLEWCDNFNCTTTGKLWDTGKYIIGELSAWENISDGELVKGFQGVRRYETP